MRAKIKGRKRHIVTDTLGNILEGVVHGAGVQDRDGAPGLIDRACETCPRLVKLFADGGYAGQQLESAVAHIDRLSIYIIRRTTRRIAKPEYESGSNMRATTLRWR